MSLNDDALNLAIGKAALQSSFSLFSRSNDPLGATTGFPTGSFTFHTDAENDPWWFLDLGSICSIAGIKVFNRGDGAQHRIRFFRVELFNMAIGGWEVIYFGENEFGGLQDNRPLELSFYSKSKVSRYLRLSIVGYNPLHLDQVMVFGTPLQQKIETTLLEAPATMPADANPLSREPRELGAIVALVRGYDDISGYDSLLARNAAIFETINKNRPKHYPLLIWHEGNITTEHQTYILSQERNQDVRFIDISRLWTLPADVRLEEMEEHWPLGYRLMCKFNSIDIWTMTRSFDYILRVDEDCVLLDIIDDPFEWMRSASLDCAFSLLIDDNHTLTNETLPAFVAAYIKTNQVQTKVVLPPTSCFPYTNVMMARGDFFRSEEVFRFLESVTRQKEFYTKRWGDHIVLGVPLSYNSQPERVQPIQRLRYIHYSHNTTIEANDAYRAAAVASCGARQGGDGEPSSATESMQEILKKFVAWPLHDGNRQLLIESLTRSGHEEMASRLSASEMDEAEC